MDDRQKRWEELSEILEQDNFSFIKEFNDITIKTMSLEVTDIKRLNLYMSIQTIKQFLDTGDQLMRLIDKLKKEYDIRD